MNGAQGSVSYGMAAKLHPGPTARWFHTAPNLLLYAHRAHASPLPPLRISSDAFTLAA